MHCFYCHTSLFVYLFIIVKSTLLYLFVHAYLFTVQWYEYFYSLWHANEIWSHWGGYDFTISTFPCVTEEGMTDTDKRWNMKYDERYTDKHTDKHVNKNMIRHCWSEWNKVHSSRLITYIERRLILSFLYINVKYTGHYVIVTDDW